MREIVGGKTIDSFDNFLLVGPAASEGPGTDRLSVLLLLPTE